MIDNIRRLAEQARAWVNDADNVSPDIEYVFYKDAYDKKFAQLIVQECACIADDMKSLDVAKEIKQHFGVEE